MPSSDRSAVNEARLQFQFARNSLIKGLHDLEVATLKLEQDRRSASDQELGDQITKVNNATAAVAAARIAVSNARSAMATAMAAWLGPGGTVADIEADVARLQASVPIVLFPVRLETRFELTANPPLLKVRIYPDEIFLNTHEYAVTAEERSAANDFWAQGEGVPGSPDTLERWRSLVARVPMPRAAYVARALRPPGEEPYSGCFPQPYFVPGGGELTLNDLPDRADVWTRAGEGVLPDRWVVVAYRKGQVPKVVAGLPIPEPLTMTPDPSSTAEDVIDLGNDFKIDKQIAWTVDYDKAVAVGMGVTLQLTAAEAAVETGGFDRLVVLGVKSSLGPLETSALVENLFDAHHYTRGLALVPQGTPTNNTSGNPTPFPPADPQGDNSFPIERKPPPPDLGNSHQIAPTVTQDGASGPGDFDRLAQALGVPNSVFRNVQGSTGLEQHRAAAMNQAMWPATLGYVMEQMWRSQGFLASPLFSIDTIEKTSAYFKNWVRGRGPVPAFRVGSVPYGVLPVLALSRWSRRQAPEVDVDEDLEFKMVRVLRRLREIWKQGKRPGPLDPKASNSLDPLAELLSEDASSLTVRLRDQLGGATVWNAGALLGTPPFFIFAQMLVDAERALAQVGLPVNPKPRVLNMVYQDATSMFEGAFAEAPGSATAATYIPNLKSAELDALWNDTVFGAGQKPLLYMMLRHSLLLEYLRVAKKDNLAVYNHVGAPFREPEQWPQWLFQNPKTNKNFLEHAPAVPPAPPPPPSAPDTMFEVAKNIMSGTNQYLTALDKLAVTPREELARLLSETLDSVSHRLDAWITAFATHRLHGMRQAQIGSCQKPIGNFLGGYGWVEALRPRAPVPPSNKPNPQTEGFIHSPSQAHASAAALLRCGFAAYRTATENKYAIDLSAERTRRAQRLVEEVRAGQTLGAALGYRFERGLHENFSIVGIDAFIYRLRHLFPLVANQSKTDTFDKVEAVAARNVVDGLALVRGAGAIDFLPSNGLPPPNTPAFNAIHTELDRLGELFDAVADLVNAEAVYQMTSGDIASAQANVDFLPSGQNAPDPELVRAERSGLGVTHRVMLLLTPDDDDQPPALPTGWPEMPDFDPIAVGYERGLAEPFVEAWVGNLVGRADKVKATVRYKDGTGDSKSYAVALSDLELRPLDLLAIAQEETLPNVGQELERRILVAEGPRPPGPVKEPTVDFLVGDEGFLSFPEVMELMRAVTRALGGARPVNAADLVTPLEMPGLGLSPDLEGAVNLKQRADDALTAMRLAHTQLNAATTATARRTALIKAARFITGAFPPPPLADSEPEAAQMLAAQEVARAELQRRDDLAKAVLARLPIEDSQADPVFLKKKATDLLKAVFGPSFFPLPPAGSLPEEHTKELVRTLAARASLLGVTVPDTEMNDLAPVRFLQQVAMVREGAHRWRSLALYQRSLGSAADTLHVMQLPHVAGEAWAGRAVPPGPGRISMLAYGPAAFPLMDPARGLRGIMIDDWVEVIPPKEEETALAFHYDHPNAEAPQAILVAVPATSGANWNFADLLGAVTETFDLTDVRSINPESLPMAALVPAPSLAFAPAKHAISTDFSDNKVKDIATRTRVVVPPGGNP